MSTFQNSVTFGKFVIFNVLGALIVATMMFASFHNAASASIDFVLRSAEQVYRPGDTLTLYGAADPDELLVIRLYDPSGLAIRIDNIHVDEEGFFREDILVWSEPSRNLPFGTYTVEAISSVGNKDPQHVEISFAEGIAAEAPVLQFPKTHNLGVKLDAPSEVTVDTDFRIFVQVTFDNALIDSVDEAAVAELLGASHIHSRNATIILHDKFIELHPGLYYADVRVESEGPYIIHAAAFYKGFLSHDSRVVSASASSIGTIQQSVDQLNQELDNLHDTLDETRSALNDTQSAITSSVDEARTSIREEIGVMQDASGQINAIILPVLALISVIIALQISLFARIRASFR